MSFRVTKFTSIILLCVFMMFLLTACGKSEEVLAVESYINEINPDRILEEADKISVAQEAYSALDEKSRSKVEGLDKLSNYEKKLQTELEEINEVQKFINSMKKEKAPTQTEVSELTDLYEKLSEAQKERVEDFEEAIELREWEKVAKRGIELLEGMVKNPSSLEIVSINVKMNPSTMFGDGVMIDYTATNSFGARMDGTATFGIDSEGKDVAYELGLLTGDRDFFLAKNLISYLDAPTGEISIDPARVFD